MLTMSSLNPTGQEILAGLGDAFVKVELQDKAVNRVHMPFDCFTALVEARDPVLRRHEELAAPKLKVKKLGLGWAWLDHNKQAEIPTYKGQEPELLGNIWGAEVFSSSKFEVVSDYPHYPKDIMNDRFPPGMFRPFYGPSTPPVVPIVESVHVVIDKLQRLRKNLCIIVKSRALPIVNEPPQEHKAIETLREMITEQEFRKYLKCGFILVKGQSGLTYQVFRNRSHTIVWKNGKMIEEICVRIKDQNIPPTDNVIAFKTIIEANETEFHKLGNVYKMAI